MIKRHCISVVSALMLSSFGASSVLAQARPSASTPQAQMERYKHAEALAQQHLHTFDNLDFDVFSNRKWDRMKESHAENIKVYWPDGHVEVGVKKHIESLSKLFVFAPDTRIKQHPIRIAQGGDWTAVYGIMQGTFTKPMTLPNGKIIQPTGKAFYLPMATIGHWVNGVMDEEYLFWDNATYFSQMGVKM